MSPASTVIYWGLEVETAFLAYLAKVKLAPSVGMILLETCRCFLLSSCNYIVPKGA